MNQTMPLQNPQQFNNYYAPHMQSPQVYHPSFPQQFSELPKSNKNRKTKHWRNIEQSSISKQSSEQPRELFLALQHCLRATASRAAESAAERG
jgi:translation initiation factor 4G